MDILFPYIKTDVMIHYSSMIENMVMVVTDIIYLYGSLKRQKLSTST